MYLVPQDIYDRLIQYANNRERHALEANNATNITGKPVLENGNIHNTNISGGPVTINNCPQRRATSKGPKSGNKPGPDPGSGPGPAAYGTVQTPTTYHPQVSLTLPDVGMYNPHQMRDFGMQTSVAKSNFGTYYPQVSNTGTQVSPTLNDVGTQVYHSPQMRDFGMQAGVGRSDFGTQTYQPLMTDSSIQVGPEKSDSEVQTHLESKDFGTQWSYKPTSVDAGMQSEGSVGIDASVQHKPRTRTRKIQTKATGKRSKKTQHEPVNMKDQKLQTDSAGMLNQSTQAGSQINPPQPDVPIKQEQPSIKQEPVPKPEPMVQSEMDSTVRSRVKLPLASRRKLPFKISKGAMKDVQQLLKDDDVEMQVKRPLKRPHSPEDVRLSNLPHSKPKRDKLASETIVERHAIKRPHSPEHVRLSKLPHSRSKHGKTMADENEYESWL